MNSTSISTSIEPVDFSNMPGLEPTYELVKMCNCDAETNCSHSMPFYNVVDTVVQELEIVEDKDLIEWIDKQARAREELNETACSTSLEEEIPPGPGLDPIVKYEQFKTPIERLMQRWKHRDTGRFFTLSEMNCLYNFLREYRRINIELHHLYTLIHMYLDYVIKKQIEHTERDLITIEFADSFIYLLQRIDDAIRYGSFPSIDTETELTNLIVVTQLMKLINHPHINPVSQLFQQAGCDLIIQKINETAEFMKHRPDLVYQYAQEKKIMNV